MHDIFFFTDIHGMGQLYDAIIAYCLGQDEEGMIIFGGDACDRGPDGYRIMKDLLSRPKVVYLMGNHEDMFCKAARELKSFNFKDYNRERLKTVLNSCRTFDFKYEAIHDCLSNGGMPTLLDWIEDGKPMNIIEKLEKLPLTFSTDTCDFCHAAGVYPLFKRVADAEYEGNIPHEHDRGSIIWSRSALNIAWAHGRTCVFGHTPIPFLLEDLGIDTNDKAFSDLRPYKYIGYPFHKGDDGPKIDMDTGAAFLKIAYVLNVLTMKAQGFKLNEKSGQVEKIRNVQL